ncbi:uncharacterized protein LOC128186198 [Crassostrea angulata]|uniref:uncharacterized protein LOC128186198 n=1 Tax=Magallana angulata TaxID=2784310 RepID=UPI0022B0E5DC|nr:uncharacterized protein LOC128186198 [Crassostrea angulata]XP_052711937.1 uncharacterized protein LOC128186198 [Crassostrea angulata]
MMDCFNFILYIFLVGLSFWFLRFLLSLLIRTFAQEQVDIAKQDRLRKQTLFNDNTVLVFKPPIENKREPYEPDEQKKETPYHLQFPSRKRIRNETMQCFAVQFTTEEFIQEALQVDPLQLDSLRDLNIEIVGTHEESVEGDRLENVQLNSLTESDIEADEVHQQVLSIDILSETSAQNGHQDDRAQTLSEQLRIRTIRIEQLPSIQMEHTGQSEYRNSSVAEENVSASNYEDSRGVLDDQVAETELQNVGPVRLTTQTGLEINGALKMQHEPQVHQNTTVDDNNGALRMQHEPQVHQNTTVDDNNGALRMQHEPQVHDNVIADDNPSQPIDAGDTESSVSNFTPFTSLMSMSASTPSSNFSSISSEDSEAFANEWIRLRTFSEWPLTSIFSTRLARNGWVSLGEGDRACCYSCHVVHEGWRIGDDPDQFHSPNCRIDFTETREHEP